LVRANMVPPDEPLKIPASATVLDPDAVHCLVNCNVSSVAVVVSCDTVAAALANPLSVIGVTNAVCVAAKAVVPVPSSR